MRFFFIKILIRLLSAHVFKPVVYDKKIVDEWLLSLEADSSGYKQYYTWRKKSINDTIALGVESKEYWMEVGRLTELKTLNALIREQVEKQKRERLQVQREEQKKSEGEIE